MNQLVTTAIVLARTDYGEADRILTLLTADYGKIRVMAKGVRKSKSRLAGGIELFSVSEITYIKGRGEIDTLVSTRLKQYFGSILKDLNRMQYAYEILKLLNKISEHHTDEQHFEICEQSLRALEQIAVPLDVVEVWFGLHMSDVLGNTPNTHTDTAGEKLLEQGRYQFSFESMGFYLSDQGGFTANHIKLVRLLPRLSFEQTRNIKDIAQLCAQLKPLTQQLLRQMI